MYEYAFDTELVRIALILGLITSMVFYNRYGVTTGGAIVPGYLALFVPHPTMIITTLLVAIVTYQLVQRWLRPRFMLWGRRLFETEIIVALSLQILIHGVLFFAVSYDPQLAVLYGIGFVLPGVIAHDMGRQKAPVTIMAAVTCALVVFGIVTLIQATRDLFGLSVPLGDVPLGTRGLSYTYSPDWLLFGVGVSVLSSIGLFHSDILPRQLFNRSLRRGGFVTAGYLALFVVRPLDILFVLVCAGITYLIVTRVLMQRAILFGRAKLSAMFLTGMTVTWLGELLLYASGLGFVPWLGFNAIAPTIVSLLANDAQRQGPARTLLGAAISTGIVFVVMTVATLGYQFFMEGTGL